MMLLTEAKVGPDKGVVFAFGRFEPPHRGHVTLAHFVIDTAAKLNADAVIFGSHSQDAKNNPLPWNVKMKLFQQLIGRTPIHFEMTPGITDPWKAIVHLMELGYTRIYLVAAGDDRVPGFQKMMQSIKQSPLGSKIKDLQVISSDVPGSARVKGISGTAARQAAISGDLKQFIYIVGPQNPVAATQIFHTLRRFMGIQESVVEFIANRWKQGKPLVTEALQTDNPRVQRAIKRWEKSGRVASVYPRKNRISLNGMMSMSVEDALKKMEALVGGGIGIAPPTGALWAPLKTDESVVTEANTSLTTIPQFLALITHLPLTRVQTRGGLTLEPSDPDIDFTDREHLFRALQIWCGKRGLRVRKGMHGWIVEGFASMKESFIPDDQKTKENALCTSCMGTGVYPEKSHGLLGHEYRCPSCQGSGISPYKVKAVAEKFDQGALDSAWSRRRAADRAAADRAAGAWERTAQLNAAYDEIKRLHFAGRHKEADALQRKLEAK